MDKKSRELVMARLYFKNRDYKLAEKSFNEYLKMSPNDVTALKSLAQVYEQNKRFDKAYEMYERCYLAEPERTGVLLDICRILLMNEIWLENVDYRRWLNLAIKAFPSNPIVVNFKAFLSTTPSDEVLPREVTHKVTNEESISSSLSKIFEKLLTIEKRVENIENKLSKTKIEPEIKQERDHQANNNSIQQPPPVQQPISVQKPPTIQQPSPVQQPTSVQKPPPVNQPSPVQQPSLVDKPQVTQSLFSNHSIFNKPIASKSPVSQPQTSQTPSLFSGFASNSNSGPTPLTKNLFAESMKKLEAPTEGGLTFGNSFNFSFSLPNSNEPASGSKNEEDAEDETDEAPQNEELPIENTCTLEPIVIKTGEEDEDKLFENRCKLYRFRDKEFKERGLGSIKVLKHKDTGKGRLIMRREAIGLVCLNCWDCSSIQRVRDTQVRWMGIDASDEEPQATVFLVKFKTPELTDTFMTHMESLFNNQQVSQSPKSSTNDSPERPHVSQDNHETKPEKNSQLTTPPVHQQPPAQRQQQPADPAPATQSIFNQSLFNKPLVSQSPAGLSSMSQPPVGSPQTSQAPSLFTGFMSNPNPNPEPLTTNLFAESMKRLNMPSGGGLGFGNSFNFSFSMPNSNEPASGSKNEEDAEDETDEAPQNEELPIENTCTLEPIVIKTGEEDEDKLFENRCKLYRFRDKEFKERGLGSIKVLKHKDTGKGRLIMRREAIGLVCLNCWDCSSIQRVRETQVRWMGIDASDGEPEATVFLVKFKTSELTDTFMTHMESLFNNQQVPQSPRSASSDAGEKPDVELVDPKLDQNLVDKARQFQLPDLFYHKLKNQEPCSGCNGCEKDD